MKLFRLMISIDHDDKKDGKLSLLPVGSDVFNETETHVADANKRREFYYSRSPFVLVIKEIAVNANKWDHKITVENCDVVEDVTSREFIALHDKIESLERRAESACGDQISSVQFDGSKTNSAVEALKKLLGLAQSKKVKVVDMGSVDLGDLSKFVPPPSRMPPPPSSN